MELKDKKCIPCRGEVPILDEKEKTKYLNELGPKWELSLNKDRLHRTYTFKNFNQALNFTNNIGTIAETQKHHPEIRLSWGKVEVIIWTHTNNNLHENDFILAAKIEDTFTRLFCEQPST